MKAFYEMVRKSTLAGFDQCHCQLRQAAMAEWLRRLTRNQMGSSRVGSNPTRSVDPLFYIIDSKLWTVKV